jgi:hypothetical protein
VELPACDSEYSPDVCWRFKSADLSRSRGHVRAQRSHDRLQVPRGVPRFLVVRLLAVHGSQTRPHKHEQHRKNKPKKKNSCCNNVFFLLTEALRQMSVSSWNLPFGVSS